MRILRSGRAGKAAGPRGGERLRLQSRALVVVEENVEEGDSSGEMGLAGRRGMMGEGSSLESALQAAAARGEVGPLPPGVSLRCSNMVSTAAVAFIRSSRRLMVCWSCDSF